MKKILCILSAALTLGACTASSGKSPLTKSSGEGGPTTPTQIQPSFGVDDPKCQGFDSGPQEKAPDNADSDGTQMAYIVSVDISAATLTYDVIQWLRGEEANEAYRQETGDDGGVPNDYYIKNDSSQLRTLPVSSDACIAIFNSGDPASDRSLQDLATLSRFLDSWRSQRKDSDHSSEPFRISRQSGRLTAIQQQWRP